MGLDYEQESLKHLLTERFRHSPWCGRRVDKTENPNFIGGSSSTVMLYYTCRVSDELIFRSSVITCTVFPRIVSPLE